MPSYWTHLMFAHDCRKQLFYAVEPSRRGELIRAIADYPHIFCTGTQGPDPFLFYLPVYWTGEKLSSILHTQKTPQLLCRLLTCAYGMEGKRRPIALSYAAGFLAHYLLDSHTHAFVYALTGTDGPDSFCQHNALETDLNRLVVYRSMGKQIADLPRPRGYELSSVEESVLCTLYSDLFRTVYQIDCSPAKVARALWSARQCYRLFYDPHAKKATLLSKAEKLIGRAYLSPIFLGERHYFEDSANQKRTAWINPFTGYSSNEDFFTLYDRALEKYAPLIRALDALPVHSPSARKAVLSPYCLYDFHGRPL